MLKLGKTRNNPSSSLKATVKDQSGASTWRIGEALKKQGYITPKQLDRAKNHIKKNSGRLSSALIQLGYIDGDTIFSFLTRQFSFYPVDLNVEVPSPKALQVMPYELAKKYLAIPVQLKNDTLKVAISEPTDSRMVEELQKDVKYNLSIRVAKEEDILNAFRKHYKIDEDEYNALTGADIKEEESSSDFSIDDFGSLVSEAADSLELEVISDEAEDQPLYSHSDAPIIKLVNGILLKAVKEGVSDIHIEPYESSVQVRYRIDGALFMSMNLPSEIKKALVSRVKILASLDITEKRKPQDGRIRLKLGGNKSVDFRISTLPTLFGERVVFRILDKNSLNVDLTKLGFEQDTYQRLSRSIHRPQGLILVTGPTGSGKTVTLYSILNSLYCHETNIMTAEDPVEFNFKGISQVNVNNGVGMTFAAALKAFLRQDPDIIMVGEIRDMETAEIAIKAAMTGHLVFSTMHTNDCVSAVNRLVDIGVPAYMVASSLTMVLAQRLGRKLCTNCKTPQADNSADKLMPMGFQEDEISSLELYGPNGCEKCNGSGYKGRVGIFELMENTKELAKAINSGVDEDQLRKIAVKDGMKTLRMDALQKARDGITSVEEVLKRTVITEESLPAYLLNPDLEEYKDGEFIIREGNTDKDFFRLEKGALIVIKNGKKIYELTQPGEIFGEMSAICSTTRTASVISNGPVVVKRFPGEKIFEIMESKPDIAKYLIKTITSRLTHANDLIVDLVTRKEKTVPKDPYFIQAWANYSGAQQGQGIPVATPVEKAVKVKEEKHIVQVFDDPELNKLPS